MNFATTPIREGSPFDGPSFPLQTRPTTPAVRFDYVAVSARNASWLLIFHAVVGAWFFPLGGLIAAGLGVATSVIGLNSGRPWFAIAPLVLHPVIAAAAYVRQFGF